MDDIVDRDEILAELTRLALDEDEAALYLAVLDLGPCEVRQAAEEAGVNRTSAYRILERLADRGLVGMSSGQPMEITPLGPEPLFEVLRREKVQELDLIDEIEEGVLRPLQERLKAERREEPAGATWRVIRGKERLEEETANAIRNATAEVYLVCGDAGSWEDPPGSYADPVDALRGRTRELDVRALMDPEGKGGRRWKELSSAEGVEVRVVEEGLGADTYIIDTEVFTGLVEAGDPVAPVAVWSDAPGLYENQRRMFEGLWRAATRYP